MQPVRVKLYGFLPITRGRYLAQVALGCALGGVLLVVWWLRWPAVREQMLALGSQDLGRFLAFGEALPLVVLAVLGLQALEALIVLRLFARRQAEGGSTPPPPGAVADDQRK